MGAGGRKPRWCLPMSLSPTPGQGCDNHISATCSPRNWKPFRLRAARVIGGRPRWRRRGQPRGLETELAALCLPGGGSAAGPFGRSTQDSLDLAAREVPLPVDGLRRRLHRKLADRMAPHRRRSKRLREARIHADDRPGAAADHGGPLRQQLHHAHPRAPVGGHLDGPGDLRQEPAAQLAAVRAALHRLPAVSVLVQVGAGLGPAPKGLHVAHWLSPDARR